MDDAGATTPATYSLSATGFATIVANASGGYDKAFLADSALDDTLDATPTSAKLWGAGYSIEAKLFDEVHAQASTGKDVANLADSVGNDLFQAWPKSANLSGTISGRKFLNEAKLFDEVYATSTAGTDTAKFNGSSGNDKFVGKPTESTMTPATGSAYKNQAKGFKTLTVLGKGGTDTADLWDLKGRADALEADKNWVKLYNTAPKYSYSYLVTAFKKVTSHSQDKPSALNSRKVGRGTNAGMLVFDGLWKPIAYTTRKVKR